MASQGDQTKRLLGRGRGIVSRPVDQPSANKVRPPIEEPPIQQSSVTVPSASQVVETEVRPRQLGRGARLVASAGSVAPSPPRSVAPSPPCSVVSSPPCSVASSQSPAPRLGRGALLVRAASQSSEISKQSVEAASLSPAAANLSLSDKSRESVPQSSLKSPDVPAAPEVLRKPEHAIGKAGDPNTFVANHIPVRIKTGYSIFEYHVTFTPDLDSRPERHKLVSLIVDDIGRVKTFDGAKLYLPRKLQSSKMSYNVRHPVDGAEYEIRLKFVGERSPGECVQHFNILLRRVMRVIGMVQIGRNNYNPALKTTVAKRNLSVWPGFITSICDFDGGYMLCAETSHRVLRTNSVLSVMYEIQRSKQNYKEEITKLLLGAVVLTDYNNKTYRIDDILWDRTPMDTFKRRDDEVSFMDYYQSQYRILIKDTKQPLLLHRVKKKTFNQPEHERILCTVPELCYMTGLTDVMRKDFSLMKDLSEYTRLSPSNRQTELLKFIENINHCERARELLDGWGVELIPELINVDGRILPEEKIFFKNSNVMAGKQANWSRDAVRSMVLCPTRILNWAIVFSNKNRNSARDFCNNLVEVGRQLGMEIRQPYFSELRSDNNTELANVLNEVITSDLQLVVVVNSTPRDDRYNLIKKITCCDKAVPSQVINAKTISDVRKLRSVTQKIALQLNCKLGGELWSLTIPMANLMVCGIDVYHNKASQHKSVLGFVSSMNATLTKWCCDAKFQMKGEEIGCHLNVSLIKAIKKYYQVNHQFPNKIIFIRDGVGDGQLDYVTEYEVEQFKKAFQSFPDYNPEYMVIVVQKRINTRIFYQTRSQSRHPELLNPPPGTVVDHTVTRKYLFDFLLVSQHVTQGTVSPTHYIVLCNNIMLRGGLMNADQVQQIMYKLTHMYYNWPGTIRVPAPTQYAHKLAQLVGQNIQKEPNENLLDRLFFL